MRGFLLLMIALNFLWFRGQILSLPDIADSTNELMR